MADDVKRQQRCRVVVLAAWVVAACGRVGFDPLPDERKQPLTNGPTGDASAPRDASSLSLDARMAAAGGAAGSSGGGTGGRGGASGAAGSSGGAGSPDAAIQDASGSGGSSIDSGGGPRPPASCTSGSVVQRWSFDASEQTWVATPIVAGTTFEWLSTAQSGAGLLHVSVAGGAPWQVEIWIESALGDLSTRAVTGAIWVDAADVSVEAFVQTGGLQISDVWGAGPQVTVPARTWMCVPPFHLNAPQGFVGAQYDPTNVTRLGLHLLGTSPAHVYVDFVEY